MPLCFTPIFRRYILLSFLISTSISCEKADSIIQFADANLLNAIIENGADRNNDGQISVNEAQATLSLKIWPSDINSLAGLEYFVNLDSLSIIMNPLESIDLRHFQDLKYLELIGCELDELNVSENSELVYLDCSSRLSGKNHLKSIDLSKNLKLKYLICNENIINALDISNNINLISLSCGYNQLKTLNTVSNVNLTTLACNNNYLEEIDLSKNLLLTKITLCGNRMNELNISLNTKLASIGIDNMPSLVHVCVWRIPFPPVGVNVAYGFSPNVIFTTNCSN